MSTKNKFKEMSFLDHLEDLRWLLIRSSIAVIVAAAVAFTFSDFLFDTVIFGPKQSDFVTYQWFCDLAIRFDLDKSFCNKELPFELQNRKMEGQFSVMLWTSITAGLILAAPFILWEIWKFISPAMYQNEKKYARTFIGSTSILFFLGVAFGYFVLVPLSINFLANIQISDEVTNQIDINSYIGLVKTTSLATGLIFELPIIIFFLAKLGIVSTENLKSFRRYAYVLILILAAFITPPDVISQIIVSIPMVILYELSIIISKIINKQNQNTSNEITSR